MNDADNIAMKPINEANKPLCAEGTLTGGLKGSFDGRASLGPKPWIRKFRDFVSDPRTIFVLTEIAKEAFKWIAGQFRALSSALFNKPAIEK